MQVEKKHLRLKCPHVKSIFTFISKHFKQTIITVYFFVLKGLQERNFSYPISDC